MSPTECISEGVYGIKTVLRDDNRSSNHLYAFRLGQDDYTNPFMIPTSN